MPLLVQKHGSSPAGFSGPVEPLRRLSFPALGTTCEIQYAATAGAAQAAIFERAAVAWVNAFEAKYSRFRPSSLLSRITAAAGHAWVEVDAETERMFALCDAIYAMTQGVLDPTALPLLRLWNYKAEHPVVPREEEIVGAKRLVGWGKVQRKPGKVFLPEPGMALDFGGFGKEYAVDLVADLAVRHGFENVLVDFGHDLRALGTPPGRPAWHIGLEDPANPGHCKSSLAITGGKGVASSGDYLRCFKLNGRRYGHILDPRTGRPVANGCTQATIVAGTCLQAGVLSTAAFVLGVPAGIDLIQSCPGAEGLIVTEKTRVQTRGFFHHVAD